MKKLIILFFILLGLLGGFVQSATADTQYAILSAEKPIENTDGSALTDLAGLRIYYGRTAGGYTETPVDFPTTGSGTWTTNFPHEIAAGETVTFFYVVTAYTSSGLESEYSSMGQKTFTGPPLPKPNAPASFMILAAPAGDSPAAP